jgi:hypothetical protein
MSNINVSRVILGGIVAGIVYDVLDFLVDDVWLGGRWAAGLKALGHGGAMTTTQLVEFNLIGIAVGIMAVWLYAAIRPRYGAGLRTAACAGIAVWILAFVLPNISFMYVSGLFGRRLTGATTFGALIEVVVGTIAGAALYRETVSASEHSASAASPKQAVRI